MGSRDDEEDGLTWEEFMRSKKGDYGAPGTALAGSIFNWNETMLLSNGETQWVRQGCTSNEWEVEAANVRRERMRPMFTVYDFRPSGFLTKLTFRLFRYPPPKASVKSFLKSYSPMQKAWKPFIIRKIFKTQFSTVDNKAQEACAGALCRNDTASCLMLQMVWTSRTTPKRQT